MRRAWWLAAALLVGACGAPANGTTVVVDRQQVPYDLLATAPRAGGSPSSAALGPHVFLVSGERLVSATPVTTSATDLTEAANAMLSRLAEGPSTAQHSAGMSTAVPPALKFRARYVRNGDVRVELINDPDTAQNSSDAPLATGQIVLTLTSVPGIDTVSFDDGDSLVQVPLPGSILTSGSVQASDYRSLLSS